ncbi:hypothetical protein N806_03665 [Rhodococcus sp. P27]|nr:hypothetical protein N806_03665 [Rhodococcus sp. P27]
MPSRLAATTVLNLDRRSSSVSFENGELCSTSAPRVAVQIHEGIAGAESGHP